MTEKRVQRVCSIALRSFASDVIKSPARRSANSLVKTRETESIEGTRDTGITRLRPFIAHARTHVPIRSQLRRKQSSREERNADDDYSAGMQARCGAAVRPRHGHYPRIARSRDRVRYVPINGGLFRCVYRTKCGLFYCAIRRRSPRRMQICGRQASL